METKRCFSCKKFKPLNSFTPNKRKYQLKADKGRCLVCYSCTKKRITENMSAISFNFETNKYDIIRFTTKKSLSEYLKKLKLECNE